MADERQTGSFEQSKKINQDKISELEQSLLKAKQDVASKLGEIDEALAKLKKPEVEESATFTQTVSSNEQKPSAPKTQELEKEDFQKREDNTRKKPNDKNSFSDKKAQASDLEKQQLALLSKSINNRTKGSHPAESGNSGLKFTKSEVFVYLIDDNQLQLKILTEKFKTTKSFKTTKGFTRGEDCLQYIQTHKYPKNSMIMVVVDFYLEDSSVEDAENGIDVLNRLKDYDPDIDVIVLSSSDDIDIAASATHFGAVSFVKKGEDDFKKIVDNMRWAIHNKAKLRKKLETKVMIKKIIIGMISAFVIIIIAFYTNDYIQTKAREEAEAKQKEMQQHQVKAEPTEQAK